MKNFKLSVLYLVILILILTLSHPSLAQEEDFDGFLKNAAGSFVECMKQQADHRLAITGITTTSNNRNELTEYFSRKLTTLLWEQSDVTVVERTSLVHLFKEGKLAFDQKFDQEKSIEIGRLLTATHIVTGEITRLHNEFDVSLKVVSCETGASFVSSGACAISGTIRAMPFMEHLWQQEITGADERLVFDMEVTPGDADIRILNGPQNYYRGMKLEPGHYQVEVSKDGFITDRQWYRLDTDTYITIRLIEVECLEPERVWAKLKSSENGSLLKDFIHNSVCSRLTVEAQSRLDQINSELVREAIAHYEGTTGKIDQRRARHLLTKAALWGDPLARMWEARFKIKGECGYSVDWEASATEAATVISDIRRLAEKDTNAMAMGLLGWYYQGYGYLEMDDRLAEYWLRKGAEAGSTDAMHQLGAFLSGHNINRYRYSSTQQFYPADPDEGRDWFEAAVEQGHVEAMASLGQHCFWTKAECCKWDAGCYEDCGEDETKRFPDCRQQIQAAVEKGFTDLVLLAHYFEEKLDLLNMAARSGNLEAMNYLGLQETIEGYVEEETQGKGIYYSAKFAVVYQHEGFASVSFEGNWAVDPRRQKNAYRWFSRAAERGYVPAVFNLAKLYFDGLGVNKDEYRAFRLFQYAALHGTPFIRSQAINSFLDPIYEKGAILPLANREGWLLNEAEKGDAVAMACYGKIIENNSPEKAIEWYQRAAEKNSVRAMYNILELILKTNVTFSNANPLYWYSQAENSPSNESDPAINLLRFNMGRLYEEGKGGVPKDVFEAMRCYEKSSLPEAKIRYASLYLNNITGRNTIWRDTSNVYNAVFKIKDNPDFRTDVGRIYHTLGDLYMGYRYADEEEQERGHRRGYEIYLKAVERGNIEAMLSLGHLALAIKSNFPRWHDEDELEYNLDKAEAQAYWFLKAATSGKKDAGQMILPILKNNKLLGGFALDNQWIHQLVYRDWQLKQYIFLCHAALFFDETDPLLFDTLDALYWYGGCYKDSDDCLDLFDYQSTNEWDSGGDAVSLPVDSQSSKHDYFQFWAKRGSPAAQAVLGFHWFLQRETSRSDSYIDQSARGGSATGMVLRAERLNDFALLTKAAEKQHPRALYRLAEVYHYGKWGQRKDEKKALQLYLNAHEKKYVVAYNALGLAYAAGGLGLEQDLHKAFDYFNSYSDFNDSYRGLSHFPYGGAEMLINLGILEYFFMSESDGPVKMAHRASAIRRWEQLKHIADSKAAWWLGNHKQYAGMDIGPEWLRSDGSYLYLKMP